MSTNPTSNTIASRRAGGCDSGSARPGPTAIEKWADEKEKEGNTDKK